MGLLFVLVLVVLMCVASSGWILSSSQRKGICCRQSVAYIHGLTTVHAATSRSKLHYPRLCAIPASDSEIIDVDFDRVNNTSTDKDDDDDEFIEREINKLDDKPQKSIVDLSLESDPEIAALRIPFIETDGDGQKGGNRFIDAKLAFMVQVDGVSYAIGVPYDHAAAIVLEKKDGSVVYMSPDSDDEYSNNNDVESNDKDELMEIMAAQLYQQIGKDLSLKRTPRVLTIDGPLEKYTNNWEEELIPKPFEAEKLMESLDDILNGEDPEVWFRNFMRKELGDEEYEKTLNEPIDDLTKELLPYFGVVPDIDDWQDDMEASKDLMESVLRGEKDELKDLYDLGDSFDHEGVALKLVSYIFPAERKSYSLVNLLKPYMLVARKVDDDDHGLRFELISRQEEKLIIPRLEQICQTELEQFGFM